MLKAWWKVELTFARKLKADTRRGELHQLKKTVAVVEDMVVDSIVDPRIIGEMDGIAAGPLNQTISESKVEDIPLPNVAEDFIAPTVYRFMDEYSGQCFWYGFLPSMFLHLTELSRKQKTRFSLRIEISLQWIWLWLVPYILDVKEKGKKLWC